MGGGKVAIFKKQAASQESVAEKVKSSDGNQEVGENNSPRYSVGIDLGTTNCVISYVDLTSDILSLVHEVFPIAQLCDAGSVEDRFQFPSFLFSPHEEAFQAESLQVPGIVEAQAPAWIYGEWARELGVKTPSRLVSSVKSWLGQHHVDPHSAFLPLEASDDTPKISPVAVCTLYLRYLFSAWNHRFPDALIHQQDVVVTIPASFDPAARELTVKAIQEAGIQQVVLLEEPQAAVYSWILKNGENWRKHLKVGDVLLVVDVGGGTTDLSLLAVSEEMGAVTLQRLAVGDHLLLGGDNMDLALAIRLQKKLAKEGHTLQAWQILGLAQACRLAKEKLLSDQTLQPLPIVVPSRGSKLMGGSIKTDLSIEEVRETLVEGFFPMVAITDAPKQGIRAALAKVALNYTQDAAVTRHLAAFLRKHREALPGSLSQSDASFIAPSVVLLNGGVFKSQVFADRVMESVNHWLLEAGLPEARLLAGSDLDFAVGRGAAYFGFVRQQGRGVRIRGGVASSYYLGIESSLPAVPGFEPPISALCIAPFGLEEGAVVSLPHQVFALTVGEPVHFRFFGSKTRRSDEAGLLLESPESDTLEELPMIELVLKDDEAKMGDRVNVYLKATISEIGTIDVDALSVSRPEKTWKVSFDVRDRGQL